ncbi:Hypothetical_protein [Hexamita inflata]|uniref:Hypothetical_protein n=1 Tax=Hexamita inflata TaxID=28002 RepID=A0AA86QEF4_9EUKA|nr:Hypothetical protein HINF_LOCUS44203 [Hexamita inflata]
MVEVVFENFVNYLRSGNTDKLNIISFQQNQQHKINLSTQLIFYRILTKTVVQLMCVPSFQFCGQNAPIPLFAFQFLPLNLVFLFLYYLSENYESFQDHDFNSVQQSNQLRIVQLKIEVSSLCLRERQEPSVGI